MKFTIFKSRAKWFWNMKADNGEIIAQSEGYNRKADAVYAVGLIRRFAATASVKIKAAKRKA